MKPIFFFISSALFLGFVNPEWKEFSSYEGKFRILAPGPMTEKVDSVETPLGTLAYHIFFHQSEDKNADNLFYMVSYCDYPAHAVHSDSTGILEDFFKTTIETATFSVDGDLIYSTDIQLDDYPGKFWRIEYLKGNAIIKTRAFLIGSRYYSTQTIMLKNKSLNPSSDKFFDSFTIL